MNSIFFHKYIFIYMVDIVRPWKFFKGDRAFISDCIG